MISRLLRINPNLFGSKKPFKMENFSLNPNFKLLLNPRKQKKLKMLLKNKPLSLNIMLRKKPRKPKLK